MTYLEQAMKSIMVPYTTMANIEDSIAKLTTDEFRQFRRVMGMVEIAMHEVEERLKDVS